MTSALHKVSSDTHIGRLIVIACLSLLLVGAVGSLLPLYAKQCVDLYLGIADVKPVQIC